MRLVMVLTVFVLLAAAPSGAEMMDQMDKHMKEHMGGGMMGNSMENKQNTETNKSLSQEAEAGGVTVNATYENPGSDAPEFSVKLDTHSVELDQYRLEENTVLRDDAGGEYMAEAASSSGSGHHREAALVFKDAKVSGAKYVELVVKGLAGVEERVFRFDLKTD